MNAAVPEGFTPLPGPFGPYFNALGPIYQRPGAGGTLCMALRLTEAHLNIQGFAHGGMLLTLADGALGINLGQQRQPPQRHVTVSMSADFLSSVKVGDWLEAHVSVRKLGRRLSFGECLLQVGERVVLRASGVFSVVERSAAEPVRNDG